MKNKKDLYYPATMRFAVNAAIPYDYLVMLDEETTPSHLIFENANTNTTGEVITRSDTK